MTMTTTQGAALLRPELVHELLVQPVLDSAICARPEVATVVTIESGSFRVPVVKDDPAAAWVREGEEIPVSDLALDEATSTPAKLAGLTIITHELANDTTPAAAEQVGAGLARDIMRKMDAAFFGSVPSPAPKGLEALAGVNTITAGAAITSTDPFVEAIYEAEAAGAHVTSFIANPSDALALAKVKKATGSNEALLGADASLPTARTVAGVPLFSSAAVTPGTIWGVDAARNFVVVRADAEIETDASVYFTSDRVAVRARMRVGFAFAHAAAVAKISLTTG